MAGETPPEVRINRRRRILRDGDIGTAPRELHTRAEVAGAVHVADANVPVENLQCAFHIRPGEPTGNAAARPAANGIEATVRPPTRA